ncbi:MAG: sulfatase family protein, partial [Candidatus Helarchaeota archaeon]
HLKPLFEKFKELDLLKNTIFILTSDHGTGLMERGLIGHHYWVYDELIKVPLIIRIPRFKNHINFNDPVELVDIFPTILDICGISPKQIIQGRSLKPYIEGKNIEERFTFSEVHIDDSKSIRGKRYKLIGFNFFSNPMIKLFDLSNDPTEQKDISKQHPEITAKYTKELLKFVKNNLEIAENYKMVEKKGIDEEQKRALKSLGYLK